MWNAGLRSARTPVLSRLVVSDSLRPHGLKPTGLLCPRDSPGKNTGVGCHFLLQGIFLIQGSKPRLLRLTCQQKDSSPRSHLGSPGAGSPLEKPESNSRTTTQCAVQTVRVWHVVCVIYSHRNRRVAKKASPSLLSNSPFGQT